MPTILRLRAALSSLRPKRFMDARSYAQPERTIAVIRVLRQRQQHSDSQLLRNGLIVNWELAKSHIPVTRLHGTYRCLATIRGNAGR
jgi:hypothetical protein